MNALAHIRPQPMVHETFDALSITVWQRMAELCESIEAQLADPTYPARKAAGQDAVNAPFDRHRDKALIALGYMDAPGGDA